MTFKVENDFVCFQFQKEELTKDIECILSMAQADKSSKENIITAKVKNEEIADLNIHQIKKLRLPPVYPYRLKISTRGKPTTSAFSYEIKFLDERSRYFFHYKRNGVFLELDGQTFTLTNPHFKFVENLEKMSSDVKNPGERLKLWSQVIKDVPKEIALDKPELLDFQFIKSDRFCLDKTSDNDFKIVPQLIYKKEEKDEEWEENQMSHQLPQGISQEFQENFLDTEDVDPYYKVGNYYMQLSEPLRECLKVIKKVNEQPLEKRKAFYLNPMRKIKKEIPESLSEDLLEDIFFETEQFKSDRISHIGKWIPKADIYIDPDDKNPWFPKDHIAVDIEDSLFHFNLDQLDTVVEQLEQKKQNGEDTLIYENQNIPVNDQVISRIKEVRDEIAKEAEKIKSQQNKSTTKSDEQSSEKDVAIIKDNIDIGEYEATREKRHYLKDRKSIPSVLEAKFMKYHHQKQGLFWLQKSFIQGCPGGLLADDMGLGKTFQTLAFLYWYKENIKNKKPILIVAPTGLLKNWQDEHGMHLKESGLGGMYKAYGESFRKDRKKHNSNDVTNEMQKKNWTLATYESIRDHHVDYFVKISWGIVVFDEIQKIKNPRSLITDASKAIESDFSIGLTGTPIENSLIDLWCISDCLQPKILGLLKDFHKKYIKDKHSINDIQDKLSRDPRALKPNETPKCPAFMLRRLKQDILKDLPKRTVVTREVNMTNEQQEKIYKDVMRKVQAKEYKSSLQAIALLKRFSIYTQDCFKGSDEEFINSNAKLKLLFEFLEKIKTKNEKVLVCVENRNLQKKIKGICDARYDLQVSIINGDVSGERRKSFVDKFGDTKGFNIIIISPKAGGVGLNIVSANHIIHLERWWNPAVEDQCNDRIFRIGQKRPVFVYYPLAVHPHYRENSFDIVLHNLLETKRKMREQTLIPSEPNKYEKDELCRMVTQEEPYYDNKESFYESEEWRILRRQAFQKYGGQCLKCENKNNLEVDHVKPRSKYPELELDINNLQILCRECNLFKGCKDGPEWDFRKSKEEKKEVA